VARALFGVESLEPGVCAAEDRAGMYFRVWSGSYVLCIASCEIAEENI
jgi:hypothetical protein